MTTQKTLFIVVIIIAITLCLNIKKYDTNGGYCVKLFCIEYSDSYNCRKLTIWHTEYIWRYHENGKLAESGKLINNRANGKCKGFYKDGMIEFVVYFVDDKQEGCNIAYYKNGSVKVKIIFNNDIINEITFYKKNGEVISHGVISHENNKNGLENGTFLSATKKEITFLPYIFSNLKYILEYKDGKQVGIKNIPEKEIKDLGEY